MEGWAVDDNELIDQYPIAVFLGVLADDTTTIAGFAKISASRNVLHEWHKDVIPAQEVER
jgi:hypothetical protein